MKRELPTKEHCSATVRALNPQIFGMARAEAPVDPRTPMDQKQGLGSGNQPEGRKTPARAKEPNRTEREYWRMLKAKFPAATIRWEAYTLRMASRATYTPDFSIQHPDGTLEFHEVKGSYVFPKALAKLRIAAGTFGHTFVLAQKLSTGWHIEVLLPNFTKP